MGEDIMGKNICKNILITISFVLISVLFFSAANAAVADKESQLFDKGYKYVNSHQPQKAVETFNLFLKEFPKSSSRDAAMYWLGKSLVQVKSFGEAKKVFSDIAKQFPESPFVPHLEKELQALDAQSGGGKTDTNAEVKTLAENAVKAINELQLRLAEAENKASASEAALAKVVAEKDKLQLQLDDEKKKLDSRDVEVKNLTDNAAKAILELQLTLSKTENKAGASGPAKLSP
jgi:outer membrane protein assembly factor BamD (BamD/ComL family)